MNTKSGREIRNPKSFKIENSLYKKFTKKLEENDKKTGDGLSPSSFIRKMIILYINDDIIFSKNKEKPKC